MILKDNDQSFQLDAVAHDDENDDPEVEDEDQEEGDDEPGQERIERKPGSDLVNIFTTVSYYSKIFCEFPWVLCSKHISLNSHGC
jgi:hypothetical protein